MKSRDSAKQMRDIKRRNDAIAKSMAAEQAREAKAVEDRRLRRNPMTGAHTFGLPAAENPHRLGRVIEHSNRVAVVVRNGLYLGMFRIDGGEGRF